jgi:hypothetical protein
VNVDTGTFSAITAEAAMLRERAGRHRRPRKSADPGQRGRRRESPVEAWHQAGYARAMQEVLIVMNEAADRAGDCQPGQMRAAVLDAVIAVAEHTVELHHADGVPPGWTDSQ